MEQLLGGRLCLRLPNKILGDASPRPPEIAAHVILYNFKELNGYSSFLARINWPLSRRGRGHLTQFRNFVTPYNFWTDD